MDKCRCGDEHVPLDSRIRHVKAGTAQRDRRVDGQGAFGEFKRVPALHPAAPQGTLRRIAPFNAQDADLESSSVSAETWQLAASIRASQAMTPGSARLSLTCAVRKRHRYRAGTSGQIRHPAGDGGRGRIKGDVAQPGYCQRLGQAAPLACKALVLLKG